MKKEGERRERRERREREKRERRERERREREKKEREEREKGRRGKKAEAPASPPANLAAEKTASKLNIVPLAREARIRAHGHVGHLHHHTALQPSKIGGKKKSESARKNYHNINKKLRASCVWKKRELKISTFF